MIKLTLKDGSVKEIEKPMSILDIAKSISEGLARMATCGEIDGEIKDLRYVVEKDCSLNILTFESSLDGKKAYWHTTSHIMAQAVKRLFPSAKLAIGPAIDDGFYYDFDVEKPFADEDKVKIEEEMKNLKTIEYIQTLDGKDELLLTCAVEDKSVLHLTLRADALSTYEYALYEVEHKGERGVLVFLSQELPIVYDEPMEMSPDIDPEEESVETRPLSEKKDSYEWVDKPSWADKLSADLTNKMFKLGDTKIKWTLQQDLLKKPDRYITTEIHMIMNPTKQTVCSMNMEKDNCKVSIEYVQCDRALDILEIPFFIEEQLETAIALINIKSTLVETVNKYLT